MAVEIILIDLSSIVYPIWHQSQGNPDVNHTSQQAVARVRAIANGHACVAVCCDSGKSFRAEIAPSYKANRPERDASLMHQIELAKERLAGDGFPIWAVRSFEADDLIASAAMRALDTPDFSVLIVSADKDLLQLVGPRVRAMSAISGVMFDEAAVVAKYGVQPGQMRDYLTLVGDASDNIKGATGIGPVKAAGLLKQFGSLDVLYTELNAKGGASIGIKPADSKSLREFEHVFQTTRALVTLRADVALPFDEITRERVPAEVATFGQEDDDMSDDNELPEPTAERARQDVAPRDDAAKGEVTDLPGNDAPQSDASSASRLNTPTALAVREPDVLAPAPSEWERQLDPRSMREAKLLARDMYDSRMFSAYGTPQAVLATMMVGRELGLPAMASLRAIHNIEGKHALSASLMVALVLKSGLAEFFEPISFSETEATYETKRKGGRNAIKLTHTMEMARTAWPKAKTDWEKSFLASGWGRNPTDMLVARACARLSRMVFPDLLAGLYTPEELIEVREALAAA